MLSLKIYFKYQTRRFITRTIFLFFMSRKVDVLMEVNEQSDDNMLYRTVKLVNLFVSSSPTNRSFTFLKFDKILDFYKIHLYTTVLRFY